jgi:hypothetical protein
MKYASMAFVLLLTAVLTASAQPAGGQAGTTDWARAIDNYKADLRSDNPGVQASAASRIREYNLQGAEEELTELLTDEHESVRMSAAYALVVVGGEKGRTAVAQAIPKEENDVVSTFYRSILAQPETSRN